MNFNSNISDQTLPIGPLSFAHKDISLTVKDLVEYSSKVSNLGRAWVSIKLLFTGKGLLTSDKFKEIWNDSKVQAVLQKAAQEIPELKNLASIVNAQKTAASILKNTQSPSPTKLATTNFARPIGQAPSLHQQSTANTMQNAVSLALNEEVAKALKKEVTNFSTKEANYILSRGINVDYLIRFSRKQYPGSIVIDFITKPSLSLPSSIEHFLFKKESNGTYSRDGFSFKNTDEIKMFVEKNIAKWRDPSLNAPKGTKEARKMDKSPADLWKDLADETKKNENQPICLERHQVNHRFNDISCPKETAIKVKEKYLHANRINCSEASTKTFIAAQAPTDRELFWEVAVKNKGFIFDLTTKEDKIDLYYPDTENQKATYGNIEITLLKKDQVAGQGFSLNVYQVVNTQTHEATNIQRMHYSNWKDFSATGLQDLSQLVEAVNGIPTDSLPMVHCRAGVGRTGTLITATILKEMIDNGRINSNNLKDELFNLILELRKQRGPAFVQRPEQFELLLEYGQQLLHQKV